MPRHLHRVALNALELKENCGANGSLSFSRGPVGGAAMAD